MCSLIILAKRRKKSAHASHQIDESIGTCYDNYLSYLLTGALRARFCLKEDKAYQ